MMSGMNGMEPLATAVPIGKVDGKGGVPSGEGLKGGRVPSGSGGVPG